MFMVGRDPKHPKAGGGDIQAWAWAVWAAKAGWRVSYLCQAHPTLPTSESCEGVRVLRLGTGVSLAWRAFRHYCEENRGVDLVYEDPIGAGRSPYLSPLYSKVPVVAVWHQVSADLLRDLHGRTAGCLLSILERILVRSYRGAQLWVPSQERAEDIVRVLGFSPSHVQVVSPTIDQSWLKMDSTVDREAMVVFLGVIRPYKAVHDVVAALPAVLACQPDARLVIAGRPVDAAYLARLHADIFRFGLSDRVEFMFNISEDAKRDLLSRARALVLPSRLEGFGIVTLEANAMGTPVIASGGVPKSAVRHLENGLRFDYGDVSSLASALSRILSDDRLFETLSQQSREYVRAFLPQAVGPSFEALLSKALNGAWPRGSHKHLRSKRNLQEEVS